MPLSPTERSNIVNTLKSQIGNHTGSGNVSVNGLVFPVPLGVFNWWNALPIEIKQRMMVIIGMRQTEVVSGQLMGETPYNFPTGSNRTVYEQQLADIKNNPNAYATTVAGVFYPVAVANWRRYPDNVLRGLWNYSKTNRFPTGAVGSDDYEKVHNWLKDLLPEVYCDVADQLEPVAKNIPNEYLPSEAPVWYISWGQNVVAVKYGDPNVDFRSTLNTKMNTLSKRQPVLNALSANANKQKTVETALSATGGQRRFWDVNTHQWVDLEVVSNKYYRYELKNYLSESAANSAIAGI